MASMKKIVEAETMAANGVDQEMVKLATGMGKPMPVQLSKAEAEKEATKDMLLANGVDEEMAELASEA